MQILILIEPIKIKIRKGVVTYDSFTVRVHKIAMVWSGKVDLAKGTVDLRTEIPFADLSLAIKDLSRPSPFCSASGTR